MSSDEHRQQHLTAALDVSQHGHEPQVRGDVLVDEDVAHADGVLEGVGQLLLDESRGDRSVEALPVLGRSQSPETRGGVGVDVGREVDELLRSPTAAASSVKISRNSPLEPAALMPWSNTRSGSSGSPASV